MGYFIHLKRTYAIRRHEFFNLIFNASGKLGFKVNLFHLYSLRDPSKVQFPPVPNDQFIVRREPVLSGQDVESISAWDGEEKAGELLVTGKPYHINYIDADTDLDGRYLFSVRTKSGKRSKGLARRLTIEAIRASPESKYYALIAFTNTPSRRLIESLGFEIADQVIYINILGRPFRSKGLMRHFKPARADGSTISSSDIPFDRPS